MRAPSLAPLAVPPFRRLALGVTISRLGSGIAPIALAFAVLDVSGSVADLGLVVGARSVANVALVLFGGVLADRLPPRVLLVGSAAASGVVQAVVAVLVLTRTDSIALLAALAALNGAMDAVGLPVTTAVVRFTLPDALLQAGTALARLGLNTAGLVGTAIAGALVAAVGSGVGIAVDAGTFLIAAICFVGVRTAARPPRARTSFLADLVAGWSAFRSLRWVWTVVLAFTVVNCCYSGAVAVLGPALADASFGRAAWSLVLAAQTLGFVVGGVLAIRLRPARPIAAAVLAVLPFAAVPAALGGIPSPVVLGAVFLVAGLGAEVFEVQWTTTMQLRVPADLLARVSSYDMLGSFVAIPVGQLLAAPAAATAGTPVALLIGGAVATAAIASCLLVPEVRHLRRAEPST